MRAFVPVFLLVAILFSPLAASGEGIREQRPNLVGGELGGKAVLYSLNYERYFNNNVGIGVGLMGFGFEDGAIGLFPLYLSLVPVGDIHGLYLSGGATAAWGAANWEELESTWIGTAAIGYLYHSEGGFWVRPTMTLLFKESFLILPGIALGGSF